MTQHKRFISRNRERSHSNLRTNLIGILTLVAILSGILLYFTNEQQNEQVLNSYCGEFGFYGKSLTLMKDGTFRFTYNGCSQANGFVSGEWNLKNNVFEFYSIEPDDLLDSKYLQVNNKLVAVNIEDDEFILCEN